MSDLHPNYAELQQFMLGRLSQRDSRRVILHLLPGCPPCQEVTSAYWSLGFEALPGMPGADAERFRYDGAVERVYDRVRHARAGLETERAQARQDMAELETRSASRWVSPVKGDARYHTWGFCELLLDRSEEALREEAHEEMEISAGLAVAVSGRIAPGVHPPLLLEELRARAWTACADARRVAGDFAGAEESLRRAEAHLLRGTGDRLEKARLLERRAVLRCAQDRTGEAARLLSRAILLYRRAGQWDRVGRVLFDLGCIQAASGDFKAALPALRQGLALGGHSGHAGAQDRGTGLLWILAELVRGVSARLRR